MVERCITMTRDMALAALDGRKRQTRRVLSPQPVRGLNCYGWVSDVGATWVDVAGNARKLNMWAGDVMIVREPYWQWGRWRKEGALTTPTGKPKMRFEPIGEPIFDEPDTLQPNWEPFTPGYHKRLARFMPAKYSRQRFKVTDVRIEQIQDISEEDCVAEGIEPGGEGSGWKLPGANLSEWVANPKLAFRGLWDSINDQRGAGWDKNPWVVAYTFEVI